MTPEGNESDGPEDVWARAHEDEFVGLSEDQASAMVADAGFRSFVFHAVDGHALAAMNVHNAVILISVDGIIRRLGR